MSDQCTRRGLAFGVTDGTAPSRTVLLHVEGDAVIRPEQRLAAEVAARLLELALPVFGSRVRVKQYAWCAPAARRNVVAACLLHRRRQHGHVLFSSTQHVGVYQANTNRFVASRGMELPVDVRSVCRGERADYIFLRRNHRRSHDSWPRRSNSKRAGRRLGASRAGRRAVHDRARASCALFGPQV